MQIPTEYAPHPAQIPPWALDEDRFRLCFAIGRAICERDDLIFVKQLYDGDMRTGDLGSGGGSDRTTS